MKSTSRRLLFNPLLLWGCAAQDLPCCMQDSAFVGAGSSANSATPARTDWLSQVVNIAPVLNLEVSLSTSFTD